MHLGKLARQLRLLGFDTLYSNQFTKAQLIQLTSTEGRILLSRDMSYSRLPNLAFAGILEEDPESQLQQLIARLSLQKAAKPFTICLSCNGRLQPVAKELLQDQLEENTRSYFTEFWQCNNCRKIYWKGSHYNRMTALLQKWRLFPIEMIK